MSITLLGETYGIVLPAIQLDLARLLLCELRCLIELPRRCVAQTRRLVLGIFGDVPTLVQVRPSLVGRSPGWGGCVEAVWSYVAKGRTQRARGREEGHG